jgi:hypothetical protein
MKYVRIIGFVAIAASALMAFMGTAAASVVTSPSGTVYTGTIKATSENYVTLHNSVGTVACNSTLEGKVEQHGAGVIPGGSMKSLTFTGCTNGSVHETIIGGTFKIHPIGNGRGLLTLKIKFILTMFGVECGYEANETTVGEITPGEHATLHVNATIPRISGSFFCGSTGNWTGSYKFTAPTNMAFS